MRRERVVQLKRLKLNRKCFKQEKKVLTKLVLEENEGNGDKGENVVFTDETTVAEVKISSEVVLLDKFLRAAALAITLRHVDN